jgi:hypothetical protein
MFEKQKNPTDLVMKSDLAQQCRWIRSNLFFQWGISGKVSVPTCRLHVSNATLDQERVIMIRRTEEGKEGKTTRFSFPAEK